MTSIAELDSRYGAPGRIVFRPGHAGYPNVVLAGKYATAEVALLGGNVLSYRPTGQSEVIFRPARRDYNRGESFHGGIPVCWPQFGNRFSATLPQHGFLRAMPLEVRGSEYSEELTEVTLALRSDAATRELWPHDFELELKVSVSMKLNLTLTTVNTGKDAFDFSCGFHPYLRVRERDLTEVRGLDGLAFFDGVAGRDGCRQTGPLKMTAAADHIFTMPAAPRQEVALLDPGLRRAIAVVSTGNTRTVVWNCGADHPMSDFDADDWRRYVCVEPVSDWPGGRTLAGGERHTLQVAIQSTLEGGTAE